jgi:hypothetical protein
LLLAPIGISLFLISVFLAEKQKFSSIRTAVLASILFLLKFTPVVLFLPLFRSGIRIRSLAAVGAISFAIISVCSIPFFLDPDAWQTFSAGMAYYNNAAVFNGVPLYLCRAILALLAVGSWWIVAPALLSFIRSAAVLTAALRRRVIDAESYAKTALLVYALAILLAGKVHVWYFVPLLFLNGLVGSVPLYFGAAIMLSTYGMYLQTPPRELFSLEYGLWVLFALAVAAELPVGKKIIRRFSGNHINAAS